MIDRPLNILSNPANVAVAVAEFFVRVVRNRPEGRAFTLALAGGSTPRGLYELLSGDIYRRHIDWEHIEFFWTDERAVPPTHVESNFRVANEALLKPLGIPANRIHRLRGEAEDLSAAALEYEQELRAVFGNRLPRFDLILLGLGSDGHTASLFPHTAALSESQRWVVCNAVPQHATRRLTMTYPILNAAAEVVFLVCGAEKAHALATVVEGPSHPQLFPAQAVRPAGHIHWYLDEGAASALRPG